MHLAIGQQLAAGLLLLPIAVFFVPRRQHFMRFFKTGSELPGALHRQRLNGCSGG
ncbi:MAG: hypothetical protein ACYCVB_18760 [Bacilli bacterium]